MNMDINIHQKIINLFKNSDEYIKLKDKYDDTLSFIDNQPFLDEVRNLESLLKQKNIEEINVAYLEGVVRPILPIGDSVFDESVDEIIDYDKLSISTEYSMLLANIQTTKKEIKKKFINLPCNFNNRLFDKLLEIYSYTNYELIRYAYCFGYEYNINHNLKSDNSICFSVIKNLIGKKFKYCRKSLEMTQERFAILFGISRCSYLLYEKGQTAPHIIFLLKFCKYFQISLDHLLDDSITLEMFKNYYPAQKLQKQNKGSMSIVTDCLLEN